MRVFLCLLLSCPAIAQEVDWKSTSAEAAETLSRYIRFNTTVPPGDVTEAAAFDEKIETPGGAFYIDGASVLYLVGSTMDWREDDFAAGFVFENPNAKGACGCGESFTV